MYESEFYWRHTWFYLDVPREKRNGGGKNTASALHLDKDGVSHEETGAGGVEPPRPPFLSSDTTVFNFA